MIKGKRKGMRGTPMAIGMKVTLKVGKHMAKVSITGQMEKSTTENGAEVLKMAMACGEAYSETAIWANGKIVRHMVMVCING